MSALNTSILWLCARPRTNPVSADHRHPVFNAVGAPSLLGGDWRGQPPWAGRDRAPRASGGAQRLRPRRRHGQPAPFALTQARY
eukprot:6181588-Pleurochrysis_carterae.AAC.2